MTEALTYDVPLVSMRYGIRFIEFLEKKSITIGAIKAHVDFAGELLERPYGHLSMNQLIPFLETAQWLLNDETAAFEFGQLLDLDAHGLFGYMLLSREDPEQIIETVVKHMCICLPVFDMEVLRSGRDIIIRLHDTWNIGKSRPFMAKIYMGSIYTVASKACNNMKVECDFASAKEQVEWESLAPNTHWSFNGKYNQVTLSQVRPASKNKKLKLVYSLAQNKHAQNPSDSSSCTDATSDYAAKVREHILKYPRQASIEQSAKLLGMSSRYLRQQLADENTSFREIYNETRLSYANLYLKDTPMTLHDIAIKLGFGDQASFTRAYKGWTGNTPGDVRRTAKTSTEK